MSFVSSTQIPRPVVDQPIIPSLHLAQSTDQSPDDLAMVKTINHTNSAK